MVLAGITLTQVRKQDDWNEGDEMASDIAELQFMANPKKSQEDFQEERDDLQEINVEEPKEEVTESPEEKAVVIEELKQNPEEVAEVITETSS